MTDRYRALSIISTIYKLVAVLVFGIAVLATVVTLIAAFQSTRYYGPGVNFLQILAAGGTFLGGTISALGIYAIGEFISLMIEVAFNTRSADASARLMNQQMQHQLDLMQRQLQLLQRAAMQSRQNPPQSRTQVN